MAGFDLAIVDEAHGTAGDLGRPWAAIHDNQRTPADFRRYLTATPRILAAPQPRRGAGGQEAEIATMADDPEGTYGAWLADLAPTTRRARTARGSPSSAYRRRSSARSSPVSRSMCCDDHWNPPFGQVLGA